jgi:hypothetical protein
VKARGSASRYNDRLQMKIDQLRLALPGEVDKADMLPSTKQDVATLWRQLAGLCRQPGQPDLKRLLTTLLDEPALAEPIAKRRPPSSCTTPGWAGCWSM